MLFTPGPGWLGDLSRSNAACGGVRVGAAIDGPDEAAGHAMEGLGSAGSQVGSGRFGVNCGFPEDNLK